MKTHILAVHNKMKNHKCRLCDYALYSKISLASVVKIVFANQLRPAYVSLKYAIYADISPNLPTMRRSLSHTPCSSLGIFLTSSISTCSALSLLTLRTCGLRPAHKKAWK